MHQQEPNSLRTGWNLAQLLILAWALTIYLMMRRRVGKDHIGVNGVVAFFLIPLYAGFAEAPEIIWLLPVFLCCAAAHRIDGGIRRMRGIYDHTQSPGDSWLARLVFRYRENDPRCKQVGEPMLSFAIGVALLPYGNNVGGYFMIGAVMLGLTQAMAEHHEQRRIDDFRNAMIENEAMTGQFHNRGRRRFQR